MNLQAEVYTHVCICTYACKTENGLASDKKGALLFATVLIDSRLSFKKWVKKKCCRVSVMCVMSEIKYTEAERLPCGVGRKWSDAGQRL